MQAIVNLTQLCTRKADFLFVYQPVAEDTADAVILVIEQERVTLVEDPFSGPAAQHKRYIAAVRVPRHRWLFYEFDTGKLRTGTCICYSYTTVQTSNKIAALHGNMP